MSQSTASSAVKNRPPSVGGSHLCRLRLHTLTLPCQERVLQASCLSGVTGSPFWRFHLQVEKHGTHLPTTNALARILSLKAVFEDLKHRTPPSTQPLTWEEPGGSMRSRECSCQSRSASVSGPNGAGPSVAPLFPESQQ